MASEKDTVIVAKNPVENEEVKAKLARLDEINRMDKSSLSPSEKKALRKEAKAIKSSLKSNEISKGTNVYFAIGAAIIILMVVIPLIGK